MNNINNHHVTNTHSVTYSMNQKKIVVFLKKGG